MSRIISTFSNTSGDLENLKQEFSSLFRFFNKSENKVKLDFEPYLNEPITEITSRILASQKELGLFHFSGHSGGSGLDFPDDEFSQQHLVDFFNTVNSDKSKLDCIFLNGCENSEIVNKLLNVPVVIGTKTKIQDSVAEKFTQDFFNSLIGAESTYKKAFQDAVVAQAGLKTAIIDRTRSEGADTDLVKENSLNEYFIVINDEKVANSKFPFKKKKTNWTKVIAFFLLALVIVLGFLFRDDILKMIRGYYCPSWTFKEKCHILVADFNSPASLGDINELLAEDIGDNTTMNKYVESKYTTDFSDFTGTSKITDQQLHSVCGYNFSLTGNVTEVNDRLKMDFKIYSDHEEFKNTNKEVIEIGNLDSLRIKIQNVGTTNGNDFIVTRICMACAEHNSELIDVAEKNLESYAKTMESPESYQNLNSHLFDLQEKRENTEGMLRALDNIASVGNNDYVLGALEQKSDVLIAEDRIEETWQTQTNYIEEVQARFENPASYDMKKSEGDYFENKNEMIAKRSELVLNNHQRLRPQLLQTLEDFEYLQEIGYEGKDYSRQIELVNELINKGDERTYPVSGKIINRNEQPVGGVNIQLGLQQARTDNDGVFEMGDILESHLFGHEIILSKDGYQTRQININEPADLEKLGSIILEKAANNMRYVLEGEVLDCNHNIANPSTILEEIFIDGTSVPVNGITYSHALFSKPGEKVVIKPPSGYLFREGRSKEIILGDNSQIQNTLHVFSRPEALRVVGRVMNNNEPLIGSNVMLKGTSSGATTDIDGRFSFMGEVDLCSEIVCSFSGLQRKSQLLKNGQRRGRTVDVGDIHLNGTIVPDDPVRYLLEGSVKMECDHKNTIIDGIFIDNKKVPVNASSYVHEIFSIPGEQVIIQPPAGYLFNGDDGILVTLGESTNIKNSFQVSAIPKRVIVRGRVVVQNDPIGGAEIKVKGTQLGTITNPDGNFEIRVEMGLCSVIECSASGYQSKTVGLDYKSVDGNILNIGDIDLTHEGSSGNAETNDLYEVILQCYQANRLKFIGYLRSLEELGFDVSDKSQNFNAQNKPTNFASVPTIFYFSDDRNTLKKVKALSSVMEEMTGDDFNIEKISTNNEFSRLNRPGDNSKKIIIQWFRGID